MNDDLAKAREIARMWAMPYSGIDSGNLYWALHVALRELDASADCLRGAASTIKTVTNHDEAGQPLPEWVTQDCRIALAHIGAQIRENTL